MTITIGILFLISGISVRVVSLQTLKAEIYWRILIPSKIIKNGIYKYIRHPMYAGGLMSYLGASILVTRSFGVALLLGVILLHFVLDRIDREEQLLLNTFGNEYLDYMHQTKMLIPFVL